MKREILILSTLISVALFIYIFLPFNDDLNVTKDDNENAEIREYTENYDKKINKDFDHSIDLTFDIVRMSPSGDTIIAGKTQPKIEVQIYDGNEKIGSTFSDEYGDWIWMSDSPLDEGIKKFSLKHVDDNGNEHISDENVIVFLEDGSKNVPKIIRFSNTDNEGLELLSDGNIIEGLSLDLVEYSSNKKFILKGRASPGSNVKVFLSGEFVGNITSDEEGYWNFFSDDIKFLEYNLKLVGMIRNQEIIIKTPIFNSKIKKNMLITKKVVVEDGNSLWRIARRILGGGIFYSEIYKNNLEKIKDPDLIFPGQVFNIPNKKKVKLYE